MLSGPSLSRLHGDADDGAHLADAPLMMLGQTPLGRWGDPKEIVSNCLFLAGEDSSYVTGQWLSPNGGLFTG